MNTRSTFSNEHTIRGGTVDLKNELIRIENIEKENDLIKIYIIINGQKVESKYNTFPNYFLLKLNEIKSMKDYQEFTFNIVNNLMLKLKFRILRQEIKNKNSANIKVVSNTENTINNEKLIYKPIININNGALSMKERLKVFNQNKNNNNNNISANIQSNISREAPKKLVINPNLRIIKSKEKMNLVNPKKDFSKLNASIKKSDVQKYLYGSEEDNKNEEEVKPVVKIKKRVENPKIIERNYGANTITKNKTEINQDKEKKKELIESLKNPKSHYEQLAEHRNDTIKVKKITFGERIKNIVKNMSPQRKATTNYSSQYQKNINKTSENIEEKSKNIAKDEKVEETSKDIKPTNKINYKNRNYSSNVKDLTIGLKGQYNMTQKDASNILNEANKQKEEYFKKEYINIEPVEYPQFLKQLRLSKRPTDRETFCEGFFIASFPYIKGQVIENSQSFPSPCGHKECSTFPAMRPEIIIRYPLTDTKNLELNNLAATICFPTGIKVCYSEEEPKNMIDDYLTSITNQKGERYYMMTYHFYQKIGNNEYTKNYEMHPLKDHLMKFGDSYLTLSEDGFTDKIIKQVQDTLELCQELGFRDYVYVPFCLSIISKYPFSYEMTRCLQSIFNVFSEEQIMNYLKLDFKINDLIMYLINSVPVPIEKKTRVKFYIPFLENGLLLKCPKINEISLVNINYMKLIELFSIENIIIIIRLLLLEKKILFIDDDYTRLSEVTNAFISLLYPFKWIHTYIPIMSVQMLKYLETFLPFLNGIHLSLMPLVTELVNNSEFEDSEDVFLIYIKEGKIDLSSSLKKKKKKFFKYLQTNVPPLPVAIEKKLKNKLSEIKDLYNIQIKQPVKRLSRATEPIDLSLFDKKISDVFLEIFVDMFKDYPKYLCLLDGDFVFNKNSFMKTISKYDKTFFEEFIDTQIFQQFTQTIFTEECDYFNKMINREEGEEENIEFAGIALDKTEKVYVIPPKYLGTDEKDNKAIEDFIGQYYPTNLDSNTISKDVNKDNNGIILPSHRIISSMIEIQDENYDNSNCLIYSVPNQIRLSMQKSLLRDSSVQLFQNIKPKNMNKEEAQGLGLKKTITSANFSEALNEKEKDDIKEIIKDYLRKIYRSENIDYKDPKIKTEILNILKKPFGREIFINLLSSNSKNIASLQLNSFQFLRSLIYNVLVESLQVAETDKLLEEIYLLIKSTMFFGIEDKGKTITIFHNLRKKLRDYPKVNQKNFWNIWFEKEMKLKRDRGDSTKQIIILNICSKMVELEMDKMIIKNIIDDLNNNAFGENSEMGKQTQKMYMRKIADAKYNIKGKK